jgi:hypothetical protein
MSDLTTDIAIGDRVSWQQREARWFGATLLPALTLTGTVQSVMRYATQDGLADYAFVVTADNQLHMPTVGKLTKLEPEGMVTP